MRKATRDPRHNPKAALRAVKAALKKRKRIPPPPSLPRVRAAPEPGMFVHLSKATGEVKGFSVAIGVRPLRGTFSREMPMALENRQKEEAYLKQLVRARKLGHAVSPQQKAGKASGAARAGNATRILKRAAELTSDGMVSRDVAARIARELELTPRYVRSVLAARKKRK
jgi:hypothetical protein